MRKPLFACLGVGVLLCLGVRVYGQDDAKATKALIEKAIQAHGGEEKLAKLNATRAKAKGTLDIMGIVATFTSDAAAQLPSQLRNELNIEVMGQKIAILQVLNGDKAWVSQAGNTQEMEGASLEEMKNSAYAARVESLVPLLKEKGFTLAPLAETKVGGKAVAGVRVKSAGNPDVNLFFDKENGLLVKSERNALDVAMKKALTESIYSDFKDVDGVKQPMKILVLQNGNKFMEMEITEVKFFEKLEASLFAKP